MAIDQSARASVLGVATEYRDLRAANAATLPMRIALFGQGATASTFSTTKRVAGTAYEAGSRYGFGSPIHLAMLELRPASGDGVGSIPIDIYPMEDADGASAATGAVVPSGTASANSTYYARIGGILSPGFTIVASTLTGSALSNALRALGDAVAAEPNMPVTVGWTYGEITQAFSGTGNGVLSALSASGEPEPGDWLLVCTAAATDAGTFSLTDPNGTVVSTTIVASAGGSSFDVSGLAGTLTDGTTDFAAGDTFTITVPATQADFVTKWKGASANGCEIEIVDELGDLTFTITQPTGGATNPTLDASLAQVGTTVWTTLGLNCLNVSDTTALGTLATWNEGRWLETVNRPMVCFVGNTTADRASACTVSSARTTDRTNSQLVAPGSLDLPFRVAARQLARIAKQANDDPANEAQGQIASGINPGLDSEQWDYTARDAAVKDGSSTIIVEDGVVKIEDVITFYAPSGDPLPPYRWVSDILKIMNCNYNVELRFKSSKWKGKALVPNDQVVTNPRVRKPMDAIGDLQQIVKGLSQDGLLADPESIYATIGAELNSQNNRRLDTEVTWIISGCAGIISHTSYFGFYFPASA